MATDDSSISLNKYISSKGLCSRREADRWIDEGRATINGKKAIKGNRVSPGDQVILDGVDISPKTQKGKKTKKYTYLALNKPVGIVTTTAKDEPDNIIDFVGFPKRIFPVGRLDKDSEGLIILTDDGDIVKDILTAKYDHEKEYEVTVDCEVTTNFINDLIAPMKILGKKIKPVTATRIGKNSFRIILTQGLNRQIRRMCKNLGAKVLKLRRIRILNIYLGELPTGKYRHLNEGEIKRLRDLITHD